MITFMSSEFIIDAGMAYLIKQAMVQASAKILKYDIINVFELKYSESITSSKTLYEPLKVNLEHILVQLL